MEKYIITTDMTADIPAKMIESEKDFHIINMSYVLDGALYDGSSENPYLSTKDFYAKLAEGKMASTSMVTVEEAKDFFLPFLEKGQDVLHLSFSSALSGCYNSYVAASEELREEYPNNKVVVIDTLCASSGEALLSYYALRRRDDGMSIDDNAEYVSNLRHHVGHVFTVDDMTHLYRGGRVAPRYQASYHEEGAYDSYAIRAQGGFKNHQDPFPHSYYGYCRSRCSRFGFSRWIPYVR